MAMDYASSLSKAQGFTPAAVKAGLSSDLDLTIKRLGEVRTRLSSIADTLFGPVPTDANAVGALNNGRPVTTMASRSRDIADLVEAISGTLDRISTGL